MVCLSGCWQTSTMVTQLGFRWFNLPANPSSSFLQATSTSTPAPQAPPLSQQTPAPILPQPPMVSQHSLSTPQQPQPQQAMDTSSTVGSTPAYNSAQPILNLQEFLSGLQPSSESAPFMFPPFGGPGPLGRESGLEDPFLTGIPGLPGVNPQDPSRPGNLTCKCMK